ncbi:tRNA dihydrouridine synthase DusB [Myxococcus sp. K15C18031901]|uniref:tRNA dihydrouridine synthase DusB n=1 Tax=Myxococcus dinghuensis TaxID=2906761 RepID=UPI0020A73150|nr:tRNA dihydrouridine synthase DusB [Myxococcus dinghuensis]MCP3100161.1 tRNA dihydrouridine synthase DusB [Myxococcus dinghuensis]
MLRLGPFTLPNPYVLAPMAGVSEMPFRVLAFRLGAALCPTELVSSQGLMRANQRTLLYLRFDPQVERPYSLQLYGGDPDAMALAARVGREKGAQLLDINMGCPVKKVTKNGAGSALLCDPARAAAIVRAMREASGLPITCKIRSGWDARSRNYLQMAAALQEAGCAGLAIHPRTREQGYSGQADWSVIADLKRHFPELPLFGNGDVKTPADARRMLDSTGCDFVMIGRGALGNPWIFRELAGGPPPSPEERCALVLEHFQAHVDFVGDPLGAVRSFRRHLAWYAHGLAGAAAFRARVNTLDAPEAVADAVRRFFASADTDRSAPEEEQDVDYRAALG